MATVAWVCILLAHGTPLLGQTHKVAAPTQLDWTFVLSNQSVTDPPSQWLGDDYDSSIQKYEIAMPQVGRSKQPLPLILFISPSAEAAGIRQWASATRRGGIILASPLGAGNRTPAPQRVRIILDVLSDIRAKYPIDPDRTYIGGFSGGGRIACMIAFALPEYFGGVIPVCAGGELRNESWLQQRVRDRLSVAQITGTKDFNRGEVERLRQTVLSGMGVRCKTWVVPRMGHSIPDSSTLAQAIRWIDEDLSRREKLAKQWPASRGLTQAPTREQASQLLLTEALQRLEDPKLLYSGLMQLKGIHTRWNDLPAAADALVHLTQMDRQSDRPWEDQDIDEQRRNLIAKARGIDAYGSGDLPKQYESQRTAMLSAARGYWETIVADGQDQAAVAEGRERIRAISKQLGE